MNHIHKRRLYYICFFGLGLSIATALVLFALKQNINVFYTPSELSQLTTIKTDYQFRLGGMVQTDSVRRQKNSLDVEFDVTDFKKLIHVKYSGILPDLFREGKGVIAEGHLNSHGIFLANRILAKHDENYSARRR